MCMVARSPIIGASLKQSYVCGDSCFYETNRHESPPHCPGVRLAPVRGEIQFDLTINCATFSRQEIITLVIEAMKMKKMI